MFSASAHLTFNLLLQRLPCFRELREHSQPHFPKFLPALPDDHNTRRSAQETNNQVTFDVI